MDELLDVIDAAVYADAFDCAVTEEELWRYARRPLARDELRERLETDPRLRETFARATGSTAWRAASRSSPRAQRAAGTPSGSSGGRGGSRACSSTPRSCAACSSPGRPRPTTP